MVLVPHAPEILAQLIHMRSIGIVRQSLHLHKHHDHPVRVLDNLLIHVLVQWQKHRFLGSRVTDPGLAEHLAELQIVEYLVDELEGFLDFSEAECTLGDLGDSSVVELLEFLVLCKVRVGDCVGVEEEVAGHHVAVVHGVVGDLLIHGEEGVLLVARIVDIRADPLNQSLSVLLCEKLLRENLTAFSTGLPQGDKNVIMNVCDVLEPRVREHHNVLLRTLELRNQVLGPLHLPVLQLALSVLASLPQLVPLLTELFDFLLKGNWQRCNTLVQELDFWTEIQYPEETRKNLLTQIKQSAFKCFVFNYQRCYQSLSLKHAVETFELDMKVIR